MLFTPSLLENLFHTVSDMELKSRLSKSFRMILLNGEVVSMTLRSTCLLNFSPIKFVNLYSVSEYHKVGAVDLKDVDLSLLAKFCLVGGSRMTNLHSGQKIRISCKRRRW